MKNIKKLVRDNYGRLAKEGGSCQNSGDSSCCISKRVGYSAKEIQAAPAGSSSMGLGCGNPTALASLRQGETVVDLGSGGGLDCFLSSRKVGPRGKVIGIDMTPAMVQRAKKNARQGNYKNVEFRLGDIEKLPVKNNIADIIISNCVINLAPDKSKVFKEALRVLKPGGRLMISDLALLKPLPSAVKNSVAAYVGCVAGAMVKKQYLATIRKAGFTKIKVVRQDVYPVDMIENDPAARELMKKMKMSAEVLKRAARSVVSIKVSAFKPA